LEKILYDYTYNIWGEIADMKNASINWED